MKELEAAVRCASARELPRNELSAAIVGRLVELGAPPESIAAAQRIALPGSVVVVAGQQPVLLGGPGLVWAKACAALAVARSIETERTPVVAVFWNASEDHDHAECDHVRMDLGSQVETQRVPLPGDRRMLSRVPVPAEARALVEALRAKFPQGPSRDEILAALEPAANDTMGSWFSRIFVRLLGRYGLVVVEPETMRPFARSVVDFELSRPGELAASIRRAEAAALARGEPASLDPRRDELFFLVDDAGRRLRVTREDNAWRVEDGRVLSTNELRGMPPSTFSWNVATRVLAQDAALPVAAQICGPSEIRYCERLAEAHAFFHVPAPLLIPRSEWVFVPPRAERLCRELGVDPVGVATGELTAPDAAAATELPGVAAVRTLVRQLPSQGSAAVQRRHAGLVQGIDAYAEALARDVSEAERVRGDRWRKASALLRPDGEGQDRRVSPLPWIGTLGFEWLAERVRAATVARAVFRLAAPQSESTAATRADP